MIDLKGVSGLNVKLNPETGELVFGGGLRKVVPGVRTLENMRGVLMDPECTSPEKVYFMYREIAEKEEIRYDITVIPPGLLGQEYVKTLGHYHPPVGGREGEPSYPEVYEVLMGEAFYLLQKRKGKDDMVLEDVVLVKARPGQKVLIPPGYGHVTINPGPEVLVMSNLVFSEFGSVYEPFIKARGAGYYVVKGEEPSFVVNKSYQKVPKLRILVPEAMPVLGLGKEPLFKALLREPQVFEYLKNPERYGKALQWL